MMRIKIGPKNMTMLDHAAGVTVTCEGTLEGFATFWKFKFFRQKKVADY